VASPVVRNVDCSLQRVDWRLILVCHWWPCVGRSHRCHDCFYPRQLADLVRSGTPRVGQAGNEPRTHVFGGQTRYASRIIAGPFYFALPPTEISSQPALLSDGVQRGLVGDIIARFEKRGYKLVGLKMVWPTTEMAEAHYADLSKKPFFKGLTEFFSSGPIVCMCWEGKDIIKQGRQMLGETQPLASKPGSIRGDYSIDLGRNICHGSDSAEAAEQELKMWFPEGVNDWGKSVDTWVYEK